MSMIETTDTCGMGLNLWSMGCFREASERLLLHSNAAMRGAAPNQRQTRKGLLRLIVAHPSDGSRELSLRQLRSNLVAGFQLGSLLDQVSFGIEHQRVAAIENRP